MIPLSNSDFRQALRLLSAFANSPATNRREREERRRAWVLVRKMGKKLSLWEKEQEAKNPHISAIKVANDKLY